MRNIVILGAGFGGVRCALDLDRALGKIATPRQGGARNDSGGWRIILVDRSAHHLYSPRLYEMIVPRVQDLGLKIKDSCSVSITEILKGTRVEFVEGEVKGMDCREKQIVISTKAKPRGEISSATKRHGVRSRNSARDDEIVRVPYDYLVLALGSGTDYFGIEGLEKSACILKSIEDAQAIRERVGKFLKVHNPPQPSLTSDALRGRSPTEASDLREGDKSVPPLKIRGGRGSYEAPFSVVIGGAGATGVEVAAELAYLFRAVPQGLWSVTLVEALSSVLWMFPKAVGEYAYKRLNKLGVHVMLDTCIKRVEARPAAGDSAIQGSSSARPVSAGLAADAPKIAPPQRQAAPLGDMRGGGGEREIEVVLAPRPLKAGETEAELACDFLPEHEKRIGADLLLWAGGVRSNPLLTQCGLTVDRKGRIEVDEHLVVKGLEGVFAIGDNATLLDPNTKQLVPATAQAALLQGKVVAENIGRLIRAEGLSFRSKDSPSVLARYPFPKFPAIVPLANRDGVALLGNRVLRGFPTWLLRQAADLRYYASIVGWQKALKRCFLA